MSELCGDLDELLSVALRKPQDMLYLQHTIKNGVPPGSAVFFCFLAERPFGAARSYFCDADRKDQGEFVSPTMTIAALWVAFAVTHMVMSSIRFRPQLAAWLSWGFQAVYSVIALGLFIPLCTIYFSNKHSGPLLYALPLTPWVRGGIFVGMGVAFILLFAGLLTPSPTSISAQASDGTPAEPKGVHFITRHALFMSMALFGILHLIANGFASDVAFFAGFPLFVLIGTFHQDQRKLALEPERYRAFYEATPWIPFTGRSTLRGLREISKPAVVLGLLTLLVVRHFHSRLFGG